MKVIYHIDAMEAWAMTLGNVRNMLDGLHQNQESYDCLLYTSDAADE